MHVRWGPLCQFCRACYACWVGPIMYVWVGPVLVCGILGDSVSFVLTALSLYVASILSKQGRARHDFIASIGVFALSFYDTLMSCFENYIWNYADLFMKWILVGLIM